MKSKLRANIAPFLLFLPSLLLSSLPIMAETAKPEEEESGQSGEPAPFFDLDHFKIDVLSKASSGIRLDVSEGYLDLGGEDNVISFAGAKIELAVSSLSLHGLSLSFDLPLDYNGKKMELQGALLSDWLYVSLFEPTRPEEVKLSYKVDLSSQDIIGEDGKPIVDEETGGMLYYEYGNLDYAIDMILNAVTDGEYAFSSLGAPNWDFSSLIDSLNSVYLDDTKGGEYYVLPLSLNGQSLEIGLLGNGQSELSGIEFPRSGEADLGKFKLAIKASINRQEPSFDKPEGADSFVELQNSLSLFTKLASLASSPKFGIKTIGEGLKVTHTEAAFDGGDYGFARDPVEEEAVLTLDATADLSGGKTNALSLQASTSCNQKRQSLRFDVEQGNAYFALNEGVKVYGGLSIIEQVFDAFGAIFGGTDASSFDVVFSFLGLNNFLSPILSSELVNGLLSGNFEYLIPLLGKVHNEDGRLEVELDLGKVGMEGSLYLTLDGNSGPLMSLRFDNCGPSNIKFDGTIELVDYHEPSEFDPLAYAELTHLPTILNGLTSFAENRTGSFSVFGYYGEEGDASSSGGPATIEELNNLKVGFGFQGTADFDLDSKMGAANLTVYDHHELYKNDHHLNLSYADYGAEENSLLFHYDSINDNQELVDNGTRTNPSKTTGLNGRMENSTFLSLFSVAREFLTSPDPRFERITSMFGAVLSSGLIYQLSNSHFLEALSTDILIGASLGEGEDVFTFSGEMLGNDREVVLTVGYASSSGEEKVDYVTLQTSFQSAEATQKVYLRIDSMSSKPKEEIKQAVYAEFGESPDPNGYIDFTSLGVLFDCLNGALTLGTTEDSYLSTYRLKGNVIIALFGSSVGAIQIDFDFFVRLIGSEIKVFGKIDLPFNGIMSSAIATGDRHVNFFYYADGADYKDGYVYLERYDAKDALPDTEQFFKIPGAVFKQDIFQYAFKNVLGFNNLMNTLINMMKIDTSKAIHGEDLFNSFLYNGDSASPSWDLNIGMEAIPGLEQLGDVAAKISGMTLDDGTLTLQRFSGNLTALNFCDISFSGALENVSSGSYDYAFNDVISVPTHMEKEGLFRYNAVKFEDRSVEEFFNTRFLDTGIGEDGKRYYNFSANFNSISDTTEPGTNYA